jgi:hypothetical protein
MNPVNVILGLAGIALGANSLLNGARRLTTGMGDPRLARASRAMQSGSSRPTIIVPRRATRNIPPITSRTRHVKTLTGDMRVTTHEVRTLGDRLATIIDQAHRGKIDPRVISWARSAVSKKCGNGWNGEQWCVKEKDRRGEAEAIFKAMRRDVRYTSDVRGYDTYAHPKKTLETHAEDCDGFAALGCAGLMAIGIPCRFEVVALQGPQPNEPAHIFIQAGVPRKGGDSSSPVEEWLSLDATVPMPPGWRAPDSMVTRRWIFETE